MSTSPDLSNMTFAEIEALYGEEAAIQAGIAADPDTFELDEEWFRRARPVREAHPEFVERWERWRDAGKHTRVEHLEDGTTRVEMVIGDCEFCESGEHDGTPPEKPRRNVSERSAATLSTSEGDSQ